MERLDVDILTVVLVMGILVIGVGLLSKPILKSIVSAPIISLSLGMAFGTILRYGFNVTHWDDEYLVFEEAARITLAIGLVASALRLPRLDPIRRWRGVLTLLGLVLPLMWLITGFLLYPITGYPLAVALLIGAAVAPTDPILAAAITEGELARKFIPNRIRFLLLDESGLNDGLGFPFVLLMVELINRPTGDALVHWLLWTVLWAVIGGTVIGATIGYGAGKLLCWSQRHGYMDSSYYHAYPIALALLTVASFRLARIDGVLGVFVAGLGFVAALNQRQEREERQFHSAVDNFFSIPIFFFIGTFLPWDDWAALGWRIALIILAVILLRRLPPTLLLRHPMRRQVYNNTEAAFVGWFGPMGVSALFYAALAVRETGIEEVWTVVSLVIVASVFVFGTTGAPLTRRLGAFEERTGGLSPPEEE